MTPRYGRCEVGKRLIGCAPFGHGKTTTFVGALRHDGLTAPCVFDGAINGEKFAASIEQELVATLSPGDIVIMDMCGRPQRCKKNPLEKHGAWSGADMCPAAVAACHLPPARMGVRGGGSNSTSRAQGAYP
jgi:hypothetical protein